LQCRSRGSTSILACHGKGNAAHCPSDLTNAI
jgi:hypothetical protein